MVGWRVAVFWEGGGEGSGSIKYWNFLNSWGTVSFSGRALLHGVSYSFINLIAFNSIFCNVKPNPVINSQRSFISLWIALPVIWSQSFFKISLNFHHLQFISVFRDFIVVIQYKNLVLFTGQHFSHIKVKFAELVHLCSQRPSTARVSSRVTFFYFLRITP